MQAQLTAWLINRLKSTNSWKPAGAAMATRMLCRNPSSLWIYANFSTVQIYRITQRIKTKNKKHTLLWNICSYHISEMAPHLHRCKCSFFMSAEIFTSLEDQINCRNLWCVEIHLPIPNPQYFETCTKSSFILFMGILYVLYGNERKRKSNSTIYIL